MLGNVVFGDHFFTIEGKSGNSVVFSRSSSNGFENSTASGSVGGGEARIVQDKYGHYYIAITPAAQISSIRITEKLDALIGLGTVKTMNVYHACYSLGSDDCEQSFSTYSESDGISLDLLGIGKAGVSNAQGAIDGNASTSSKINIGTVGVGASIYQHVNFHTLSGAADHFRVKMKMSGQSVVTADILGSIIIKAYNGDVEVFSQRLNEKLIANLDLLGLLSSGEMLNIPFAPGKAFDRVAVGISSLVGASVINKPLEIFSIERFLSTCPTDPELLWEPKTDSPFNTPDCAGTVVSFENVNFPYEAVTDRSDVDSYATLTAGAGVALGVGAYSGSIELKFDGATPIPAKEVSYIRIDGNENLLKTLLGGSLGSALGDLLGSVALGQQYIEVQMQDAGGNPIGGVYSSASGLNTELLKLVKDASGRYYLAVTTATLPYQSVRISYHHTALIGAMGSSSLKVYSMCRETEFDACEQATFTSWDGSGIPLDIGNLAKGGVANPEFAIDDNNSNYATLNMGVVGVGASVSQKIYFKTKSSTSDKLRLRLQLDKPNILAVDLLGSSRLILYNGDTKVYDQPIKSGLLNDLDLLGLFNSGGAQTFTFAPAAIYDRVELKISSTVSVGTGAPIRLYSAKRLSVDCEDPDVLPPTDIFEAPECANGVALGNVEAVDDVDFAFDSDYNTYARMRADAGILFGIGGKASSLELTFGNPAPANRTSYLRIGDDVGLLQALLSGSVGETLYNVLNGVALGDNYFVIRAKGAGANVLEGSSQDNFAGANDLIKIVQDKAGRYYVAI